MYMCGIKRFNSLIRYSKLLLSLIPKLMVVYLDIEFCVNITRPLLKVNFTPEHKMCLSVIFIAHSYA